MTTTYTVEINGHLYYVGPDLEQAREAWNKTTWHATYVAKEKIIGSIDIMVMNGAGDVTRNGSLVSVYENGHVYYGRI